MPSRTPTPRATLDHVLSNAIHIGRDAVGEATAKGGFVLDLRERLGTVDYLMALGERIGAVAIEQIFERGQALECDALLGELIRQRRGLVSVSKRVLHLLEPNAFRVRPVEQAIEAMILIDRAEAENFDLASGVDRGREGVPCLFERHV